MTTKQVGKINMERQDIQKHVLEYAHNCTSPFTAAEAFEAIDAIETPKQVSDALGRLYNQRILARRKVDKIRYEYIRAEISPVGFEMAPEQPAHEIKTTEPEKTKIKTQSNTGSIESAIIGLGAAVGAMAEMTTKCNTDKEPSEHDQSQAQKDAEIVDVPKKQPEKKCTLSDDALIEKASQWVSKLCDSGGRAWALKIPIDFNNDPDIIFSELTKRFSELKQSKIHAENPAAPTTESQSDWLQTAHHIVHGDREKTYGDPGKNLRLIAQYWSTHTGITITETDVCIMMQLLKIARLRNDPEHVDSWIDIAGYTALKNRLNNASSQNA